MSARCELCFHHCDLAEGRTGFCRARVCRNGAVVPPVTNSAIEEQPWRELLPCLDAANIDLKCLTQSWAAI